MRTATQNILDECAQRRGLVRVLSTCMGAGFVLAIVRGLESGNWPLSTVDMVFYPVVGGTGIGFAITMWLLNYKNFVRSWLTLTVISMTAIGLILYRL